jgi:light-regulated signal transduction histidine kinase (bacteriophytochrome)
MRALQKRERELRQLNQELEERITQRTEQIRATNNELQAFSYSVSHDLRAHLRAISGYAQILHEDHNHQLDPDGLFILEKLQAASQKMNQVINSLLDLSRLERQELGIREIPAQEMSERIRNIFDTLAHVEPQRQVEFKIRSIPGCRADPDLLDQIWINLISNALKFTRKRAKAQVIVGSKECSSTNALATEAYFVEDNGVGFDMKYADKLFKVFERLHSSEEYEGSGVGLVIVERIISRHGGQIWVESAIDQGTTFYFTIP